MTLRPWMVSLFHSRNAAYLLMCDAQESKGNQLTADMLKAFNAADVVSCGHGQLCANVDLKGQRFGDSKKPYLVIRPR